MNPEKTYGRATDSQDKAAWHCINWAEGLLLTEDSLTLPYHSWTVCMSDHGVEFDQQSLLQKAHAGARKTQCLCIWELAKDSRDFLTSQMWHITKTLVSFIANGLNNKDVK